LIFKTENRLRGISLKKHIAIDADNALSGKRKNNFQRQRLRCEAKTLFK